MFQYSFSLSEFGYIQQKKCDFYSIVLKKTITRDEIIEIEDGDDNL